MRSNARENIHDVIEQLQAIGATKVLTYDALFDKSLRSKVKEWTNGKVNWTVSLSHYLKIAIVH
jgi:glutaredoxin-related protein